MYFQYYTSSHPGESYPRNFMYYTISSLPGEKLPYEVPVLRDIISHFAEQSRPCIRSQPLQCNSALAELFSPDLINSNPVMHQQQCCDSRLQLHQLGET